MTVLTTTALERLLQDCAAQRRSGVLRVSGDPGGTVYLADGKVTAISTPGAPDPEVILLRSGRVPEPGWSAAFAAAAASGAMGAELVRQGLIGAGELEAVLRLALADGMFALAAGRADDCHLEPADLASLLPLEPGAEPGWLLAESNRRIETLAAQPQPIAHDRDRVSPVPGAWTPRASPGDGQSEIVALANGRRTARDMAFVLGRGVYAVTLQLDRMREAGVLTVVSSRAADGLGGPALDLVPGGIAGTEAGPPDGGAGAAPPLPRRRRPAGLHRSVGLTRRRST
jgi:hypothetical protein